MENNKFLAGDARVDITPPMGTILGVDMFPHYARFIHDPHDHAAENVAGLLGGVADIEYRNKLSDLVVKMAMKHGVREAALWNRMQRK